MQRLLREDVEVKAETPEEQSAFKQATEFTPASFTSFHMCPTCATDTSSPAIQLSKKYEELARSVDTELATQIAQNEKGVGRQG
jgi:hypothetical protein